MNMNEYFSRGEIIAYKLKYIHDVFILNKRADYYKKIESSTTEPHLIKKNIILDNIFSIIIKTNISLRFKAYEDLHNELQKFSQAQLERLLTELIPELQSKSSDNYLDVFGDKVESVDEETLKNEEKLWRKILEKIKVDEGNTYPELDRTIDSLRQDTNKKRLEVFQRLYHDAKKERYFKTAFLDFMEEYETGNFTCRYITSKYYQSFFLGTMNEFVVNSCRNFYKLMNQNLVNANCNIFSRRISCLQKVKALLKKVLNQKILATSKAIPEFFYDKVSQNITSVLLLIMFSKKTLEKKIEFLNGFHDFDWYTGTLTELSKFAESYRDLLPIDEPRNKGPIIEPKIGRISIEFLEEKDLPLLRQTALLFKSRILTPLPGIYKYLIHKYTGTPLEWDFRDNLASTYRDLTEYGNAVSVYQYIEDHYTSSIDETNNKEMRYRLFLVRKNVAYCYYKMGKREKSEDIFDQLENNVEQWEGDYRGAVHSNLATRYRLMQNYQKELFHLVEALKYFVNEETRRVIIKKRYEQIKDFFENGLLKDADMIRRIEKRDSYDENYPLFQGSYRIGFIKQALVYLELSYRIKEKDHQYWQNYVDIHFKLKNKATIRNIIEKLHVNDDGLRFYAIGLLSVLERDHQKLCDIIIKMQKKALYNDANLILGTESQKPGNLANNSHLRELNVKICIEARTYLQEAGFKKVLSILIERIVEIGKKDETLGLSHLQEIETFLDDSRDYKNLEYFLGNLAREWASFTTRKKYARHQFFQEKNFVKAEEYCRLAIKKYRKDRNIWILFIQSLALNDKIDEARKGLKDYKKVFGHRNSGSNMNVLANFVDSIEHSKIRYTGLNVEKDSDLIKIIKTIEYNLFNSDLNEVEDELDFTYLITEVSKIIEVGLGRYLADQIFGYLKENYNDPAAEYARYPSDTIFKTFLKDPRNNNPGLGNWLYIFRGFIENLKPRNPINKSIITFLDEELQWTKQDIEEIYDFIKLIKKDRNESSHRIVKPRSWVLTKIMPIIPRLNHFLRIITQ